MAPASSENEILITGAGLGGLALAQVLREHGVSYEMFERYRKQHARRQGTAVVLIEPLMALEALLPADLGNIPQISVNQGIDIDNETQIRDAITGQYMIHIGGVLTGSPGYMIRANRERLSDYLGSNTPVQTDEIFDHYAEDADGVTVFFKDSSAVRDAVLIGCDGARSHTRTSCAHFLALEVVLTVFEERNKTRKLIGEPVLGMFYTCTYASECRTVGRDIHQVY